MLTRILEVRSQAGGSDANGRMWVLALAASTACGKADIAPLVGESEPGPDPELHVPGSIAAARSSECPQVWPGRGL
jgi:hypothetical protein